MSGADRCRPRPVSRLRHRRLEERHPSACELGQRGRQGALAGDDLDAQPGGGQLVDPMSVAGARIAEQVVGVDEMKGPVQADR
jgi:hypothetical protein